MANVFISAINHTCVETITPHQGEHSPDMQTLKSPEPDSLNLSLMNFSEHTPNREEYKKAFADILSAIGDDEGNAKEAYLGFIDALELHMIYHASAQERYLEFQKYMKK